MPTAPPLSVSGSKYRLSVLRPTTSTIFQSQEDMTTGSPTSRLYVAQIVPDEPTQPQRASSFGIEPADHCGISDGYRGGPPTVGEKPALPSPLVSHQWPLLAWVTRFTLYSVSP